MPQVRKYKTKVSKVWLSRTKNYNIGKGRLTGDFETSDEETESIRQGQGSSQGLELKDGGMVRTLRKGNFELAFCSESGGKVNEESIIVSIKANQNVNKIF